MFKFVFVRHPFERLVSAYNDKFFGRRDPDYLESLFYHEKPVEVLLKASFNKFLFNRATTANFKVTFEKFARFVIYEIQNRIVSHGSYHWMPYTDFCGLCLVNYDFVGKLETLGTDLELLSRRVPANLNLTLFKDIFESKKNSSPSKSEETSKLSFSSLPKSLIRELFEAYKMDFLLGDYPYPANYIDLGKDD
jgi:hypothetical protein